MRISDFFDINNELINDFMKLIKSFSTRKRLLMNNINFDMIIN